MNNRVIVIKNKQKDFQLHIQLQLSTCENVQLQLQPNRVINYNFVNYNYNFSKPDADDTCLNVKASKEKDLESLTNSEVEIANLWMKVNKLTINAA